MSVPLAPLISLLAGWFLADFIGGIIHWWEDRYLTGNERLGWMRELARDNARHHSKPTAMLIFTPWENMRSGAIAAWPVAVIAMWLGAPLWLVSAIAFSSFGNLVHRWAHTPPVHLPRWICGMQEFGLFLSHAHHHSHHRDEWGLVDKSAASRAYCPMTDWVNPVLDYLKVWQRAERFLAVAFGIRTIDQRQQPGQ